MNDTFDKPTPQPQGAAPASEQTGPDTSHTHKSENAAGPAAIPAFSPPRHEGPPQQAGQQNSQPIPQPVAQPARQTEVPPAAPKPGTVSGMSPSLPRAAQPSSGPGAQHDARSCLEAAAKRDLQSGHRPDPVPMPHPNQDPWNLPSDQPASQAKTNSGAQADARSDPQTGSRAGKHPVPGPERSIERPPATPNDPTPVGPTTKTDLGVAGQSYPEDTDEELSRIAADIISSRAETEPVRQVRPNASRIRGLLKKTCNVKEIYNHLVSKGRIDPSKVSYKQFANQVKKLQEGAA
jgi:hypothetical protein